MKQKNNQNKAVKVCFDRIIKAVLLCMFSTLAYGASEGKPCNMKVTKYVSEYPELYCNQQSGLSCFTCFTYFKNTIGLLDFSHQFINEKLIFKKNGVDKDNSQLALPSIQDEELFVSFIQPICRDEFSAVHEQNLIDKQIRAGGSLLYLVLFLLALLALKLELNARSKR